MIAARLARLVGHTALVLAVAGCAHSVDPAGLSRFSEAAGKVHAQADAAFTRANAVSRTAAIDVFVASRRPGLTERAFPPVVDADTVAAWDAALSDLERYGALVAQLSGGGRGRRAGDGIAGLGRELRDGHAGARIDPGIGAAFASLAGALVDAQAQSSARQVLRATNPSVRTLVTAMAEAVGTDRTQGLQGTVWSNWTAALNGTRTSYAAAAERGDDARQRALVADFLSAVDRRDADLRLLASLRTSLLSLADAHAAAAAGSAPGQEAAIAGIDRRLDDARRAFDTLEGSGK